MTRSDVYQLAGKKVPEEYFSAMFIRHPYERLMSAYTGGPFNNYSSIESLVEEEIAGLEPWEINEHLRPQAEFCAGLDLHFIGRVDRMDEDWKALQMKVGCPSIPKHNRSPTKHDWRDVDFDWDSLRRIYEPDFYLLEMTECTRST